MMAIRLVRMREKGAGERHLRSELDLSAIGRFSKLAHSEVGRLRPSARGKGIPSWLPPKRRHVFDGQKVEGKGRKGTAETGENAVDRRADRMRNEEKLV